MIKLDIKYGHKQCSGFKWKDPCQVTFEHRTDDSGGNESTHANALSSDLEWGEGAVNVPATDWRAKRLLLA